MCENTRKQSIHSHPAAIGLQASDIFIRQFMFVRGGYLCIHLFLLKRYSRENYRLNSLWRCKTINDLFINEQIRDKEVRVVSEDGEQLGIMSAKEAQDLADEAGLDLVKIAPNAKPPVCKIVDYSKYKYEQARREKESKKKQKTIEIKEIRLSPNIDTNDLNTKINKKAINIP